jgi:hypothetical protein
MKKIYGLLAYFDPVQRAELEREQESIETIAERFDCPLELASWWFGQADQAAIDAAISPNSNVVPLLPSRH